MTPADVVFSITRALDPDAGSGNSLAGQLEGILRPAGIKAVDDHTVRFSLEQAYVFFPNAMATRFARIYKAGTTEFTRPVGTGPFRFVSLTPGREFVAERNSAFWRNKVALDRVVITNVTEDASRVSSLLAGRGPRLRDRLAALRTSRPRAGTPFWSNTNARVGDGPRRHRAPFTKP